MAEETVVSVVAGQPPAEAVSKPTRSRSAFDTATAKHLERTAAYCEAAQRPACAAPLAEREISVAFVSQLAQDTATCQSKLANAANLQSTKKDTTARERIAKKTLLERTTDIQTAAVQKWSGQPAHKGDREAYGIGKPLRSLSRAELETVAIGISQRLNIDTLPGITPARVQAFRDALTAWQSADTNQSGHTTDAAQLLIEVKAEFASITERRIKLQLAADSAFPYYDKENTALRAEFGLPKTRPFRPNS